MGNSSARASSKALRCTILCSCPFLRHHQWVIMNLGMCREDGSESEESENMKDVVHVTYLSGLVEGTC